MSAVVPDQPTDKTFLISNGAWARLSEDAERAGRSRAAYFRHKAWRAIRIADPKFNLGGAPLLRGMHVTVSPLVLDRVYELCDDLAVPHACAGELICALDLTGDTPNSIVG
jgi:hypothetical protein